MFLKSVVNLLVFVFFFSLFIIPVFSGEIVLNDKINKSNIKILSDNIMDKSLSEIVVGCNISKLITNELYTPKGKFASLSIPGFQSSSKVGAPALPVMNKIVEIPFGAKVKVTVLKFEKKEYSLNDLDVFDPIMPRQPPQIKTGTFVPFAYEQSAYLNDLFQQEELVSVKEVGNLRGLRLAMIKIAPIAYNPVAKKIRVFNNIKIRIELKNSNMIYTFDTKKKYYSPYFSWISKEILVPTSMKLSSGKNNTVTYLIVSDPMFKETLKPFIDWKTKKGFKVKTVYTDSFSSTSKAGLREGIQNYIKDFYNNPPAGYSAPSFVLFVGDNEQIPAFEGTTGGHISDLYYVSLTPGDNIPDILTGRFSARNIDELTPQIEKTLEYEKYLMPDPSFLKDVVLTAGWDYSHTYKWGWPQIKYGLKYYFNEEHGIQNTHVYLTTGSGQFKQDILKDISNGCAFVNYTAHGSPTSWADPNMTISNINAFNNSGKYPLVVGNCCLTNRFQVGTCFGEAWLRANKKGAIGYIGGSNSTYWDEDLWWGNGYYKIADPNPEGNPPDINQTGVGAYDNAFKGDMVSNAGMILAGNLAVEESNSSRKLYYWEIYHLMGDPSVLLYWGVPGDNKVVIPTSIKSSRKTLTVQAKPGSFVSVTMNSKIIGSGYVDNSRKTVIVLNDKIKSGIANIVVTGKNLKPYFQEMKIVN